jgi:hypothetical protein
MVGSKLPLVDSVSGKSQEIKKMLHSEERKRGST